MARQARERLYDAKDLKMLMERSGNPARGWSGVRHYLETSAEKDSGLSPGKISQLGEDIRYLEDNHIEFSKDYRKTWRELAGNNATEAPEKTFSNPAAIGDRIPGDTESFDEESVVHSAEESQATPSRVLDVLRRVESKEYKEIAAMIESSGDAGWERAR